MRQESVLEGVDALKEAFETSWDRDQWDAEIEATRADILKSDVLSDALEAHLKTLPEDGSVEKVSEELLAGVAITDVVESVSTKVSETVFLRAILLTALKTHIAIQESLARSEVPDILIQGVPEDPKADIKKMFSWILKNDFFTRNGWSNWLRLCGILEPISYETVHQEAGYELSSAVNYSNFLSEVSILDSYWDSIGVKNLQQRVLKGAGVALGSGNARDEMKIISSTEGGQYVGKLTLVDGSDWAEEQFLKKKQKLNPAEQKKINFQKDDIVSFIENLKAKIQSGGEEQVDFFYSLSSLHYFDTPTLTLLLKNMYECLSPEGHLAFSVKAPGTTFDGVGISLIDRQETFQPTRPPDKIWDTVPTHRVYERSSIGLDGQRRFFRDSRKWQQILEDCGFTLVRMSHVYENDYEFEGQGKQIFYQCIFKKAV
ncbi:class I SAM-dependent methyltransferase [Candidatus Gracilibacteria bacterium]|nr:class I SAM-dependent methyltransferase [Candidatus Gracilibacteria bacterium]